MATLAHPFRLGRHGMRTRWTVACVCVWMRGGVARKVLGEDAGHT